MSQMIGFNIYRTERISLNGVNYTIRFTSRKDGQEYKLLVSNESNDKQASYEFTEETASDFKHYHGEELQEQVARFIEGDIKSGLV